MARMQGKTLSDDDQYFAGVDVSKAHLDLRVAGARRSERFGNDEGGIAALVARLGQSSPGRAHLVVLEPTGRYHIALWRALDGAGHRVAPINPYAARHLAEGMGFLAKTDRLDAIVLCAIAERHAPDVKTAPDDFTLEIKELYAARRSFTKRRAMSRTQASASNNAQVRQHLADEDAFLTAQIKTLTIALTTLFKANSATRRTREILVSIPGIADGAAIAILAELPEIGQASRGEIAALTGTAPMTRESGQWKGRARTRGGRRSLRATLHMNAVAAMTHNPDLKAFADGLRAKGKHIYAVLTAVLRKLLILANTLVAENRLWTPQRP